MARTRVLNTIATVEKMTTDFRITMNDGSEVLRSVKPIDDLNSQRTIEKLEVERAFWAAKGLDWGIVTGEQVPKVINQNKSISLAVAANQVDIKLGLDEGLSLFIVKYLNFLT